MIHDLYQWLWEEFWFGVTRQPLGCELRALGVPQAQRLAMLSAQAEEAIKHSKKLAHGGGRDRREKGVEPAGK